MDRFDGYTFKVFRPVSDDPQSISHNWITSLFQDDQGMLWIGTRSGGLNRYDPTTGKFTRFKNDPANQLSLSSDNVQVVFEDSLGRLWVGTAVGLDRFFPDANGFTHYSTDFLPAFEPGISRPSIPLERTTDNITTLFEDDRGSLWVGTANAGLGLYDEEKNVIVNLSR